MYSKKFVLSIIVLLLLAVMSTSVSFGQTEDPPANNQPQFLTDNYALFMPIINRANSVPGSGGRIVIDHNSVDLFSYIPDQYIQAASQKHMLFRHASVGWNISEGLDCLMNKTQPRPPSCDRGVPINEIISDPKYYRDNWTFEYHLPLPAQNPGWYEKVTLFINRVDSLGSNSVYEVYGYKFGYVDAVSGSNIDEEFFNPNTTYPSIMDLEALEDRYPNKTFVYWTMGLARSIGTPDSESFNQQLRTYAAQHNKILIDFADIGSHTPNGAPCFDNGGNGIEALCDEYTDEEYAGHLNGVGKQRMAKAIWVLMARLSGWNP